MGLSFITEGAIPFAAADPLRVIPACAVGSAVAGALSMLFNASLRAPHGGIFVVPVVTNPIMYFSSNSSWFNSRYGFISSFKKAFR